MKTSKPEDEKLEKETDYCFLCHLLIEECKCPPELIVKHLAKMKTKHKEH